MARFGDKMLIMSFRLARVFAVFMVTAWLLLALPLAAHAARVRSFDTVVRANRDASLDVSETIVYDFEGANRHGIFQKIPVVYDRGGGTYTLKWELQSVTDENGVAQPYSTGREGRDLSVRIGDADTLVSGVKTYNIKLRFWRAIIWSNGAPEVYWNATGNKSQVPIEAATAKFIPPPGVQIPQVKTRSFRGPFGTKTPAQTEVESRFNHWFSARDLAPREGLTFVAGLPAGSLVKPPAYQNLLWFAADWWSAFTFPILAFVAMLMLWRARGRDVDGGLPAQVEWSPPRDMTPAEVGTLINETCDMTDILSTLIDLAARGYLVIEDLSSKGAVLGIGAQTDYAFTRTHQQIPLDAPLRAHEADVFARFVRYPRRRRRARDIGEFEEQFLRSSAGHSRVNLPRVDRQRVVQIEPRNHAQRLRRRRPFDRRIWDYWRFSLAGFLGTIAYGIGLIGAGLIVAAWARAMPAKTALGSRRLRECIGFQRFVQLAEKPRIEKLITDDPTVFGRLLPYAMVLGVGEIWATKFSDLMTEAPDWYFSNAGDAFVPYLFVSNLGSGMNEMGTTFASQPAPTQSDGAGGGNSGFSDGGGFSGGGFGGGGVGDW